MMIMFNFQSLEVVDRGSETQLRVAENFVTFTLKQDHLIFADLSVNS